MTILDVAELTGLNWDTVKDLVKKRLAKDYAHIRLKDLRRLAIDEIYVERNRPPATAYLLKEELALAWEAQSWEAMADYFCDRCEKAIASGIDQLVRVAQSLTDHAEGLPTYAKTGMTSGRREGINRKIKTRLRQFYGLRDSDFLRIRKRA